MPVAIDSTKYCVTDEVALRKTRYLRLHSSFIRSAGGKEEASCFYLKRLVSEQTEKIPNRIVAVFAELGRVHFADQNDVQTIGAAQVHISQFVWGRMCVLAYFIFHDEPVWQSLLFRKLDERITVPELAEDVRAAKNLIDAYYEEQALFTNAMPAPKPVPSAVEIAAEAAVRPANTPKPENIFNFAYQRTSDYHRLIEFLMAEKADCTDVEWARYALEIYRNKGALQKHPSSFTKWLPVFCEMFGRSVRYREPNKLDKGRNQKNIEVFLP